MGLQLAGSDASPELRAHALNNAGTARVLAGDPDGMADLREALAIGLEHGYEEHVARVYCNLASTAVQERRLDDAGEWLAEALGSCEVRDLDAWHVYLLGWLSRLQLERGDLDAARATAIAAAEHPRGARSRA